ncbi:MAG TPA: hypothetical protein VGD73_05595 [Pseudonocardia sp.]|jgi:hypothetical protein|uniref:hypothetical protein n=1 Tax=Pseudonocardia sp. TaxID=60912 RepID=UPI002ED9AF74
MITHLVTQLIGSGAEAVPTQVLNPPPQAPPGIDQLASQIVGWLKWGVLVVGVAGILVCAAVIIIGRRHRGGLAQEGLIGSLWVLGGLTLASLAAVLVGAFAGPGAQ